MTEILQYAAIGLGPAAIYALAAVGVVAIYRGSGIVNFSQGGLALLGASAFVKAREAGWPTILSIPLGIVVATLVAALLGLVVDRFLRNSARVMQVIATLGFLSIIQEANFLVLGGTIRSVPGYLPKGHLQVGDVRLGYDRLALLVIACVLTVTVHVAYRSTSFGRTTSAAAEDRRATASLGYSPSRIAISNWAVGGALAGLAGVLIVPISGYAPGSMTLIILPAFAAALVGRFDSFLLALAGAVALGVTQSVAVGKIDVVGMAEALPFVLIVAVLLISSRALPGRGETSQRLPRVATNPARLASILLCGAAGATLVVLTGGGLQTAVVTMTIGVIAILSHVVLLGYAGQVSLANYAFAGIGALVAGRLSEVHGWPFPVVGLIGLMAAALTGLVFGFPALRSRGVTLAIVTLGLGIAVSSLVFSNADLTGGFDGTRPRPPSLFGIDVSSPTSFGLVVVATAIVLAIVVRDVRAGRLGRRMLAIRGNERAAASLGISVSFVKLYAFVLSAAIVGCAGVLQAFRVNTLEYTQFNFNRSLQLISSALVGAGGYVSGSLFGAPMLPNGVVTYWLRDVDNLQDWLLLVGGALLILTLILNPDGVARALQVMSPGRQHRKPSGVVAIAPRPAQRAVHLSMSRPDAVLSVERLTVRFGSVVAVDDVTLRVRTGQVVGVLGANGAGKTTLIDAISGFVPVAAGSVHVNGLDITSSRPHVRNRHGLGRSFQSVELFEDLTVRENLLIAAEPTSPAMWLTDLLPRPAARLPAEAIELADSLGLTTHLDKMPSELPHGLRGLLGVARTVLTGCPLLLLDEPAAGLDDRETTELAAVLTTLAADYNIGILLVEHHVGMVIAVSDEVVVMDFGRNLFRGHPHEALRHDEVRRAYLGMEVA